VPSSTTMTVEKFVPAGTLDPIYFDASYYLVPEAM
jgi:non-homologous end joining protein Ku